MTLTNLRTDDGDDGSLTQGGLRRMIRHNFWIHRMGAVLVGLNGHRTYNSLCGKLRRRNNHGRFTEDPRKVNCRSCINRQVYKRGE